MKRTIEEINEKIRSGSVVVVNAEEVIGITATKGTKNAAQEIDVVTTGTFSPMCSSGVFFNIKQDKEKMKLGGGWVTLNGVPAYAGLAAADIYLGATALPDADTRNGTYPGKFKYGGAHVIEELVSNKKVMLSGDTYGTDCYPKKRREKMVGLDDMNEAILFNPRNCYQNYNVALNLSDKPIYTYMGKLKPRAGNANYCSASQLSPLLNDPLYRTIGIGTRVFIAGAQGYVSWYGTQHNPNAPRLENATPRSGSGTLALIGNLKEMSPAWLRAVSYTGYGVSLSLAVGVPIPILDEEMMQFVSVSDKDLKAPIVDYGAFYPRGEGEPKLGEVSYAELKTGQIQFNGKKVPTGCFSSHSKALEIAENLKKSIQNGDFLLSKPVASLPGPTAGKEG